MSRIRASTIKKNSKIHRPLGVRCVRVIFPLPFLSPPRSGRKPGSSLIFGGGHLWVTSDFFLFFGGVGGVQAPWGQVGSVGGQFSLVEAAGIRSGASCRLFNRSFDVFGQFFSICRGFGEDLGSKRGRWHGGAS